MISYLHGFMEEKRQIVDIFVRLADNLRNIIGFMEMFPTYYQS